METNLRIKFVLALCAAVIMVLAAACGGDDDYTTTTVVEVETYPYVFCPSSQIKLSFDLDVGDSVVQTRICATDVPAVRNAYKPFSEELLKVASKDGIEDSAVASAANTHLLAMKGENGKLAYMNMTVKVRRPNTPATAE